METSITADEQTLLAALRNTGPLSTGEVAAQMPCWPSLTVCRLLWSLKMAGLVTYVSSGKATLWWVMEDRNA